MNNRERALILQDAYHYADHVQGSGAFGRMSRSEAIRRAGVKARAAGVAWPHAAQVGFAHRLKSAILAFAETRGIDAKTGTLLRFEIVDADATGAAS